MDQKKYTALVEKHRQTIYEAERWIWQHPGRPAKASYDVKVGDQLQIQFGTKYIIPKCVL